MIQDIISKINERLITQDKATKDKLYKTLDIELLEKTQYFELNARCFASGLIDLNASQYVYNSLKNWSSTTLAERIVIMQLIADMLKRKIKAK